jgi:hypothetical protein
MRVVIASLFTRRKQRVLFGICSEQKIFVACFSPHRWGSRSYFEAIKLFLNFETCFAKQIQEYVLSQLICDLRTRDQTQRQILRISDKFILFVVKFSQEVLDGHLNLLVLRGIHGYYGKNSRLPEF